MIEQPKRSVERKKVLIPARVSGIDGFFKTKCVVRDANDIGCMIVSSRVTDLPDQILLEVPYFKVARKGLIVWRDKKSAGVKFV